MFYIFGLDFLFELFLFAIKTAPVTIPAKAAAELRPIKTYMSVLEGRVLTAKKFPRLSVSKVNLLVLRRKSISV